MIFGKMNFSIVKVSMVIFEMGMELLNLYVVVKWVVFKLYCIIVKLVIGRKVMRKVES